MNIGLSLDFQEYPWIKTLLIIPLTSPFTVIACLILGISYQLSAIALLFYLLSLVIVAFGGRIARKKQWKITHEYVGFLVRNGNWLKYDSLFLPENEQDCWKSLWNTIELKRKSTDWQDLYRIPDHISCEYDKFGCGYLFTSIHRRALCRVLDRDGYLDKTNLPQTWKSISRLAMEHYDKKEIAIDDIKEMLDHSRNETPMDPDRRRGSILESWSYLINKHYITGRIAEISVMHSIAGRSEDAFDMLQFGLRWARFGHVNEGVSRLCQWSGIEVILNSVKYVQQNHIGQDKDWLNLKQSISTFCCAEQVPSSLRGELSCIHYELCHGKNEEIWKNLHDYCNTPYEASEPSSAKRTLSKWLLEFFLNKLFSDFFDAYLLYDLRRATEKSHESIMALEGVMDQLNECSYSTIPVDRIAEESNHDLKVFPNFLDYDFELSLKSAWQVAQERDIQIRMAMDAVDLERHYIAYGEYPQEYSQLSMSPFLAGTASSGRRKYARDEEGGFSLDFRSGINEDDDLVWKISPELPCMPEVRIE